MLVCLAFLNTQYFNVMIKSLLANYLLLQDDAELSFPIKVVKLDQKCTSLLINFFVILYVNHWKSMDALLSDPTVCLHWYI